MYTEARGHRLDYRWAGRPSDEPQLVFLHEGLGSVALWREYPEQVATQTARRGLVLSRYGHGKSDPLSGPRDERFMHDEALTVLPGILDDMKLRRPILVGHSDGASISLIYAGAGHPAAAMVLIAPHVMVESKGLGRIRELVTEYETTDLADRIARYHTDGKAIFESWANVWLSDEFRSWDLSEFLPRIKCPILLVQSQDDAYGTLEHLDIIESHVQGPVQRLILEGDSHSPHLSHAEQVTEATVEFINRIVD